MDSYANPRDFGVPKYICEQVGASFYLLKYIFEAGPISMRAQLRSEVKAVKCRFA